MESACDRAGDGGDRIGSSIGPAPGGCERERYNRFDRADLRNPDGMMFYKIWNGRAKPKMPAVKTDISQADVWTVIHYVRSLRK